jgi:CRP-like cAMP-binding protein
MTELELDTKVLEAVPLFSGLPPSDLEDIVRLGQKVSFDAGVDIVQSGDPGDSMYVLLEGRTDVDVGGRFHRLGPGDFFGEMALLGVRKRLATVKTIDPVEALKIPAVRGRVASLRPDELEAHLAELARVRSAEGGFADHGVPWLVDTR